MSERKEGRDSRPAAKYLFLDRDGTLIEEPKDFQIDSLAKFRLVRDVIPALLRFREAGYRFVMISNQDGLGSYRYPREKFEMIQNLLLGILETQGILFEEILICPHLEEDGCLCRKPRTELVHEYLIRSRMEKRNSYVIGDRVTDLELARRMGIEGIRLDATTGWKEIADQLLLKPRTGACTRNTRETQIQARVNLDSSATARISTGIGFFDHMLEQIAKHGGFELAIEVKGDTHVDDHHTVEDTALALGEALRDALGDKRSIERFGFHLPMDDAAAQVALDLSGRPFCRFEGDFERPEIGGMATEMVPHFFRSLADGLGANLHIKLEGQNTHHRIESAFKAVGRSLRAAIAKSEKAGIPSTKGTL